MRVVHVINRIAPAGAERQLTELVRRSELDHRVIELPAPASGSKASFLARLRRELRAARPAVTVAWLERPQLATAAVGSGRLVACVRGLPSLGRRPAERWLLRAALTRFDLLVANSDTVRSVTRAHAEPAALRRFAVIPNGVEIPLSIRRSPRHGLHLAFIGRAPDPDKGLDLLLRALDLIPEGEVTAVLVGSGVPEATARHNGGRVRVALGAVDDPWAHVGAADALVVPSRSEGSPNVVLEAFSRGIPVIGTGAGGMRELLEGGRGTTVPVDDPDALARAIRLFAADPDRGREAAERARHYVIRAHAWPRVVTAYDATFRALAGL